MAKLNYGDRAAQLVSGRIGQAETSIATLKQIPANKRVNGQIFQVLTGDAANTFWQWIDGATATGDDVLCVLPNDGPTTGRFMRCTGAALLAVPFYATTPTGTNVLVVPSGAMIALKETARAVSVSVGFTGVANCAIGFSSSNHPNYTGIANFAGSMVMTQLSQMFSGTGNGTGLQFQMCPVPSGAGQATGGTYDAQSLRRTWMKGGDTVRFDLMQSGTTGMATGVGRLLIACDILANPGV
jgi:hypothetical protein